MYTLCLLVCFCAKSLIFRSFFTSRGVFRFLKPGWLRGENVVQVKHFDACTLYFLKNRGGQNHPNHPGNYTSEFDGGSLCNYSLSYPLYDANFSSFVILKINLINRIRDSEQKTQNRDLLVENIQRGSFLFSVN